MALIGGWLASTILKRYDWRSLERDGYAGAGKLEPLFGVGFWDEIRGKTVIDFGCGEGNEALEIASHGAAHVIGLETLGSHLAAARKNLANGGFGNCEFVSHTERRADVILSLDSFEHFDRPNDILREMARLLAPGGRVIVSFGLPWYHPYGGHLPLFPWGHLVFTERALLKWRAQFKHDGATRFHEADGGLNQMSISRFLRLVEQSPLKIADFKTIPIRAARPLHCRLTREFLTSVVQAKLIHRAPT